MKAENKEFLLDDAAMRRFIVDGFVKVRADYPASFHEIIYGKLEEVFEKEGNIGNNVLPRIPEIQRIFEHPAVRGALTSILGPDYFMNPHRHPHLNKPGSAGQEWHKDCYVFDHNIRHPRLQWVLALYYPQDVNEEMGPTAILPGRQNYKSISDAEPDRTIEPPVPLCGEAGTVSIVHFDGWHRAMANRTQKKRFMLKFQFARMREPEGPSWNCRNRSWKPVGGDTTPYLSEDVWNWLGGNNPSSSDEVDGRSERTHGGIGIDALANLRSAINDPDEKVRSEAAISIGKIRPVTDTVRSPLMDAMEDSSEAVRLNAAYGLGGSGETVVPALIGALRVEAKKTEEEAMAKTPANLHRTNPNACCSAQALSAVGAPAVAALVGTLEEPHWWMRTLAANTLGNIGPQADEAVPALVDLLKDGHWWVRRNAAEALGRIGSKAAVPALIHSLRDPDWRVRGNATLSLAKSSRPNNDAIPNLIQVLSDENRYNRFYASLALSRLGTTEAREALINDLFTSRWCPITTNKTPY